MISRYQLNTPLGPVRLASDEEFVTIVPSVLQLPEEREEPLTVLLRMASAATPDELGQAGPVIASLANRENTGNPELRRYEAKFGRDALYTATFLNEMYPALEAGTVRYFAAYQATDWDVRSLSEPGKLPNHVRSSDDPLARRLTAATGRRWPWFGGMDTTVLFILSACRVAQRDLSQLATVVRYPSDHPMAGRCVQRSGSSLTLGIVLRDAVRWLLRHLDDPASADMLWVGLNDKDSYTVWTDSPNAFHFRDGQLAAPPVAPVQLQAETFDALRAIADIASLQPDLRLDPQALSERSTRIKRRVLDHFVVDHRLGPYLANAVTMVDGHLRPLDVRTIAMGMALDSNLLTGPDSRQLRDDVVKHLSSPEMTSPFGIVGRARDEVRFEPFDYHSQVWGFAVYRTARGLDRHGYGQFALDLNRRLLQQTQDGLLPENVGADESGELRYCPHILTVRRPAPDGRSTLTVKERTPAAYAAWTAGAVVAVLDHDDR